MTRIIGKQIFTGAFIAGPQEWMKFDEYPDFTLEEGGQMRMMSALAVAGFWMELTEITDP
jgi:hypothetical protein